MTICRVLLLLVTLGEGAPLGPSVLARCKIQMHGAHVPGQNYHL